MVNRPRLLIIFFVLCAGSITQAQFLPYREIFFTGQPSNSYFDSLGFKRSHGVYEKEVTGGTPPVKETLMRSKAHTTLANYTLYEKRMWYDIEYLSVDSFRVGRVQAIANAESLAKYIGWAKNEEPTLQVGIYSMVPVADVYMTSHLAQRRSANNLIQVLADSLDYLCPSIYLYYAEAKRSYASYAVPMVAEARRMAKGKKVIAFVAPGYHPSGDYPNQYASYSVWKNVLHVIMDSAKADGFILFAGVNAMGSQYSDWARADTSGWWRATKEFMASLQSGGPPATPALLAPTQGAVINPPAFTARWQKMPGAVNYHVQLADNVNYQNALVNDSTLTDTLRQVSSLTSGKTYYIRVRAKSASSWSSYSTTVQFSTSTPTPPAPSLITPQAGALIDPPTLTVGWRKAAGAVAYHLQLADNANFQSPLVNDSTLVDTTRQVTGLKSGTTYYIRLRAKGASSWGAFGATIQFATSIPSPGVPSLVTPTSGAIIDPPSFTARWHKVVNAVGYHVQLADNASFQNALVNDSTLTDTLRQVTSLASGKTYYLRVRAKSASSWSSYSTTVQFSTSTPTPPAPSLITPQAGALIDPPTLTVGWRKAAGAVAYHLQLADNANFQSPLVNDSTLVDTTRQVTGLKSGTTYYIRLRAKGASSWGAFGATIQFATSIPSPGVPSLVTPTAGAVIDPPSFTARWRKVVDATGYHVQLADNSSFLNLLVNDSTLTDTLRQVSSLTSGKTYYIRVRAKSASSWSSYSTTVQFSTSSPLPTAPVLLAPRQGWVISPVWLYIRWQKVSGALAYHLQLAESDTFQNAVVNDSTVTDTTSEFGPLKVGTTYYIRVRAKGTASWTRYSPLVQFVTSVPPPAVPSLVTPTPGAVIDPPSFTARWRNVSGAIAYHVQLADNSSFQNALVNDSTLTDTLRQVGPLLSGTTYYIRVRAKGVYAWSGFGNPVVFTTSTSTMVRVSAEVPMESSLEQNFPNPFNPSTTIRFSLRYSSGVKLGVYNLLGQLVRQLINAELGAGVYEVRFDASGLPSGVYIYRIQTNHLVDTKRLLLLK